MLGIDTSRVFLPRPTGFTAKIKTYGINGLGYDRNRYDIYKLVGNRDDINLAGNFYEFLSQFYDIDLSYVPKVRPYVQYVDFLKANGGSFKANDDKIIDVLRAEHNTLVLTDEKERDFVAHVFYNLRYQQYCGRSFEYNKEIPKRFQDIKDVKVQKLFDDALGYQNIR